MITLLGKICGTMVLPDTGKDGIQLNKVSNNILAENFISYVNEFVLTKSN